MFIVTNKGKEKIYYKDTADATVFLLNQSLLCSFYERPVNLKGGVLRHGIGLYLDSRLVETMVD